MALAGMLSHAFAELAAALFFFSSMTTSFRTMSEVGTCVCGDRSAMGEQLHKPYKVACMHSSQNGQMHHKGFTVSAHSAVLPHHTMRTTFC